MLEKILIIVALNLIVYFRLLRCGYIIDDQLVPRGKGKNWLHTLWLQLTARKYHNAEVEHLQRIVVHILVSVMVYLAFGAGTVSFIAALLFSVHPANNQGVGWLNGIGYSVSALLALLMVAIPTAGGLFYLGTLWWHVTAFPVPLVSALTGHPWALVSIWGYLVIAWMVKWRIPFGKLQEDATMAARWTSTASRNYKAFWLGRLVFVVKCFAYYFYLALLPVKLGLFITFGYSFAMTEEQTKYWTRVSPVFWLGCATIVAHLCLISAFWNTPLSYGLLWFDLCLAPFCNLVTLQQTMAERYLYLPNAGLMYAVSWSILKLGGMA